MAEANEATAYSIPVLPKGDIFTTYDLEPGVEIGGGKFKYTVKSHKKLSPSQNVAVKLSMRSKPEKDKWLTEMFQNEVKVMRRLKHPHVVAFEFAATFALHHAIVMELCQHGRLSDFIGRMDRGQVDQCFLQTSHGLQYIHSQNVVHRDISLDNILIGNKNNVKIADFDLSEILEDGQSLVDHSKGTLSYMAPEMLKDMKGPYDGYKLDMYALGVVFWCIWFQKKVRKPKDYLSVVAKHYWPASTWRYRDILENLLNLDPEERWNVDHLVSKLSTDDWILPSFPPTPDGSDSDEPFFPPPFLALSSGFD